MSDTTAQEVTGEQVTAPNEEIVGEVQSQEQQNLGGQEVDTKQVQEPVVQQPEKKLSAEQEKLSRAYAKLARDMRQHQQQSEQLKTLQRDLQPFLTAKQLVEKGDHAGALQALNIDLSAAGKQLMEGENPSQDTINSKMTSKIEQLESQNKQLIGILQQFQLQTEGSKLENEFHQIMKNNQYDEVKDYYSSWEGENITNDLVAIVQHYRENEGRALTMQEAADIMKIAVKEKIRLQRANPAFCKLYGITPVKNQSPPIKEKEASNPAMGLGLGSAPPATAAGQKSLEDMTERELVEHIKREQGWL